MKAIVAVDENWGIGKRNGLLFRLPVDMRRFRAETLGKTVIMGSKTLLSFPDAKPLPGRRNIVLWPGGEKRDDCEIVGSLRELAERLEGVPEDDVYVIGGAMFYRTMLPYCSEALVTKVAADGGAEVFFENLDRKRDWRFAGVSAPVFDGDYLISFALYENKKTKPFRKEDLPEEKEQ